MNYFLDTNKFYIVLCLLLLIKQNIDSSLALGIILTFVAIIIFILISKNDLGVTTLKKDPDAHTTLIGSVAKSIAGSDILGADSIPNKIESNDNAIHN